MMGMGVATKESPGEDVHRGLAPSVIKEIKVSPAIAKDEKKQRDIRFLGPVPILPAINVPWLQIQPSFLGERGVIYTLSGSFIEFKTIVSDPSIHTIL